MRKDYPLPVVYILLISAMLLWSIAFIWVSQTFELGFKPLTVAFLRMIIATTFLTILSKIMRIKDKIHKKDYKLFFFLGFAEPFCYFLGSKYGMYFDVTPSTAAIFVSLIPLIVPFLAWFFLKESVSIHKIIGLIISFGGVMLIIVDDMTLGGKVVGFLLMGISVISGSAYSILVRKLSLNYSAVTITKYQMLVAGCLFMPLFFMFEFRHLIDLRPSLLDFRYIFFLGMFSSGLAFTFLAVGVRKLGAVLPSIMSNLIPVFTAIFSVFILNQPITSTKVIAMCIVILGLFISQLQLILLNLPNLSFKKREIT